MIKKEKHYRGRKGRRAENVNVDEYARQKGNVTGSGAELRGEENKWNNFSCFCCHFWYEEHSGFHTRYRGRIAFHR